MRDSYDVIIIGGGPAGTTAATFLAKAGRSVMILEKEHFPRFHIGESLLPYSMEALDRLGVRKEMDQRFMPKEGADMVSGCGKSKVRFLFKNGFKLKHTKAYQVERADFDEMLLRNAEKNGAAVREGCAVRSVDFLENGVRVHTAEGEIEGKYLIDASGRQTVLGHHFGLKHQYEHLKKFAVHSHYDGMKFIDAEEQRVIRIVRAKDRWFWVIPLSMTRTSIGMVMDAADFREARLSPEEALEQGLREQPVLWERLQDAQRATPVRCDGDYSYRNMKFAGDRWILAGDAAGFIDPIFSTGVFLAILSGENAAKAMDVVLGDQRKQSKVFARYEKRLNTVMDMYLKFATNWYDPAFFEVICVPRPPMQLPRAVNAVLAGNLVAGFSIWWRMQMFYLFVAIQKRFPIVPRLSLAAAE